MSFHKCRLCLKIGDFCSIFEKDDTIKLSDMVMSFADVKIYEGDGFSDRVCTSCIENLSTAYLFKQQCERIDSLVRKYPEMQTDKSPTTNFDDFCEKEFHMHMKSDHNDNDNNSLKDLNTSENDTYFSAQNSNITQNSTFQSAQNSNISQNSTFQSAQNSNISQNSTFQSAQNSNISQNNTFQSAQNSNLSPNSTYQSAQNSNISQNSTYYSVPDSNKSLNNSFHSAHDSNTSEYNFYETSDETDSDIDSIKCVYCSQSYNNYGAHKCHVTCTIENNQLQRSSSNETLVASDLNQSVRHEAGFRIPEYVLVSCVLCDEKFDQYDDYVIHLNKCTTNVKLHHFVCPICHELFTAKLAYLEHLKVVHYKEDHTMSDAGVDCVDFAPMIHKTSKPKSVRRQIGWSIEDIYQEIECNKIDEKPLPPSTTNSPIKNFFSKLGNESFSKQSTPKKVSFRKFIENGKAKTSVYLPFRKYIQNYKQKKKAMNYSPINSKMEVTSRIQATFPETVSDSDYNSPSGTSEESWKMKQNLICACDKKTFMLSEFIHDRDRITAMINELGGVVAENTKMEMLATHFISVLPNDTFTGMMVCSLATGKWLLNISYIYDSFRCKKFLQEAMYEWLKNPKIVEIDNTSVEVAKAGVYWQQQLQSKHSNFPFEGKQIVLIMKKKYRQYYHMIFKTLKAKPLTYDPRTPGSCCSADYCFVDMKIIERVKLRFFFHHNVPVFPYQYILVYLLKRGHVQDEHKYLLQDCSKIKDKDYFLNNTC